MSGGLVKWVLEHLEKSHNFQRIIAPKRIVNIMSKKVSEYELRGLPVIENPRIEKHDKNRQKFKVSLASFTTLVLKEK